MAVYYWVKGSAMSPWNATNTGPWALTSGGAGGAGVPTIADDVIFDGNSNALAGNASFTLAFASNGAVAKNVTISAPGASGTKVTLSGVNSVVAFGGSLSIATDSAIWSHGTGGTGQITFNSTAAGNTITTNGIALSCSVIFNGVGGTWTLGSALTAANFTVTNGTFNTSAVGNYAVTCTTFNAPAGTKTINLNASTVTVTAIGVPLSFTAAGLTFNCGTSQINFSGSGSCSINGGNYIIFYNIAFTGVLSTASSHTITGAFITVNNFSIQPSSSGSVTQLTINNDLTVNGIFTFNGNAAGSRLFVHSSNAAAVSSLSAATASISYVDFQNISAGGTATWSGVSIGNCDGTTGITFAAAKTVYWKGNTANTFYGDSWSNTSGGTGSSLYYPLAQDIAIFDNTGSVVVNFAGTSDWQTGSLDFTAKTSGQITINITLPSQLTVYRNWTATVGSAIPSVSNSLNTSTIAFKGRRTQTITGDCDINLTIQSQTGTVVFASPFLNSGGGITLISGALDTGGFAMQGPFVFSGGNFRTVYLRSSVWDCFGNWDLSANPTLATIDAGTSTIKMSSLTAKTFSGGAGKTYYNLVQTGSGTLTIVGDGMIFNDIQNTNLFGSTISLTAASITVANFTLHGINALVSLISTTAGTAKAIIKSGGGTINATKLSIKDISVSGTGATWNADGTCVNAGNNTGWNFPIILNSSNFFMMFN